MKKFWMVLGSGIPVFHHPTKRSAFVEAERLARLYPASTFTVLEALALVKKSDMAWTKLEDDREPGNDEGVPF